MKNEYKIIIDQDLDPVSVLSSVSDLSKTKIKRAMTKGAVWFKRPGKKQKRLRRATAILLKGDELNLYYSQDILDLEPPLPTKLEDKTNYSIWYKPPGLLSQGSRYGDACSLIRQVELIDTKKKNTFLVHRLDRWASGLILVAHDKKAARLLSEIFRERNVEKKYRVSVNGKPESADGMLESMLDEKVAKLKYEQVNYDNESKVSELLVNLYTGRKHQIRRQLSEIGCPVVGDSVYGEASSTGPMRLVAEELRFQCPFSDESIAIELKNYSLSN